MKNNKAVILGCYILAMVCFGATSIMYFVNGNAISGALFAIAAAVQAVAAYLQYRRIRKE